MAFRIPEHSIFSQNRRRRFQDEQIFRDIFNTIVIQYIERGLVSGECIVSYGSFIPGNVASQSKTEVNTVIEKSTVHYLDCLDDELRKMEGFTEVKPVIVEKTEVKSSTDPECGYINQERKKGLGYLAQMTVDTDHGIITGVDRYPANRRESDIILRHIARQMDETGISIKWIALDAGYDIGIVHRGFELLGITDYCSIRRMHNNAMKKDFSYHEGLDCFHCVKDKQLTFSKLIFKRG